MRSVKIGFGRSRNEVVFLRVKRTYRSFLDVVFHRISGLFLICVFAIISTNNHLDAQQAPAAPQTRFVVVLDAAHGGADAGGHLANNQLEKSFTLALSVRLRSLLSARGIQVVTTRDADVAVEANRRAEIANHAQAQVCLILHATDNGTGSGLGVHLFTSSLTPAAPPRFAAWKTAQAGWVARSLALAGVLNSALTHAGMNVTLGRASVAPLDSMTCPAVAVEIAPEMGADKHAAAGLDDPDYQARVATALAAALVEWRAEAR
jgi:N-acetylmuramoyl-L-alanine amidase